MKRLSAVKQREPKYKVEGGLEIRSNRNGDNREGK